MAKEYGFNTDNVAFGEYGLLPDKRISEWIVERGIKYLNK